MSSFASMERLSMAHSSHAAKTLGLDRHTMKTLSAAERLKMVHAKIEDHHTDDADAGAGVGAPTPEPEPGVTHTRDTMKTLSHVDRVAAVMQHLDEGVSHEELSKIHGTSSVAGLGEDSLAFVKGAPPPSPGGSGAGSNTDSTPQRTVSEHAQSALDTHSSKMESMKHLLMSVKMLREKPLLTSKLQEMGRVLARKMNENPTTASALEADDAESKLKQAFESIMDGDHSGQLEYGEFKHGLSQIGLDLGGDIRELFEAIDTDNSGTVDVMEFIAAISAAKNVRAKGTVEEYQYETYEPSNPTEPESPRSAAASEKAAPQDDFTKFDVDRDGSLNRAELTAYLTSQGFEIEEDYIADLLKRYGGSTGAGVTRESFPYMWQHMFHTDQDGVRTVNLPVHDGGFGFELKEGQSGTGSILVGTVQAGSAAATAGIMENDEAVMVGQELLQNVELEQAREYARVEAELVSEMEAVRAKAGGRYRSLKDAPIRTKPTMSAGIAVDTLKASTTVDARETSKDENRVEWIHVERGWAPTVSEQGEQLVIRVDGRHADSTEATVSWRFGPQHAADATPLPVEEQIAELQSIVADCQGMLDSPSLGDAERGDLQAQMDECLNKLQMLGVDTDRRKDPRASEEQLREMFEDYDQDQDEFLRAEELQMLMLDGFGYDKADITPEYVYECLQNYGDSEKVDFSGFVRLHAAVTGQEQSGQETEQEIEQKFHAYDSNQDGFLSKEDVLQMLMTEFGYTSDETTDGVVDGLMMKFAEFDANGDGSIDLNEFFPLWNHFSGLNRTVAPTLSPLSTAEMEEKFAFYDQDQDGLLSTSELTNMVMSECGYDDQAATEEFAVDLISQIGQFDTNGDGSIDINEFPALWEHLMNTVNGQAEGGDVVEDGAYGAQQLRECWVERNPDGLGFDIDDSPDAVAQITDVYGDGALAAGLCVNDVIVDVEGMQITSGAQAVEELQRSRNDTSTEPIRLLVEEAYTGAPEEEAYAGDQTEAPPMDDPMTGYDSGPPPRAGGGGLFAACLGPSRARARERARNPPHVA